MHGRRYESNRGSVEVELFDACGVRKLHTYILYIDSYIYSTNTTAIKNYKQYQYTLLYCSAVRIRTLI
jgi:hypothetical protein